MTARAARPPNARRHPFAARRTLYAGIEMRSRLEADFAAYLDSQRLPWTYEPEVFAGPAGQWLPDFLIPNLVNPPMYVEVKPVSATVDALDAAIVKMSLALLSKPTAFLMLVKWQYGCRDIQAVEIICCDNTDGEPCWHYGIGDRSGLYITREDTRTLIAGGAA